MHTGPLRPSGDLSVGHRGLRRDRDDRVAVTTSDRTRLSHPSELPNRDPTLARASRRARLWPPASRREGSPGAVIVALELPALFMQHPMVPAADQRQVFQFRLAAVRPPAEVMSVAPAGRPVAALEDTVPIPRNQRPSR